MDENNASGEVAQQTQGSAEPTLLRVRRLTTGEEDPVLIATIELADMSTSRSIQRGKQLIKRRSVPLSESYDTDHKLPRCISLVQTETSSLSKPSTSRVHFSSIPAINMITEEPCTSGQVKVDIDAETSNTQDTEETDYVFKPTEEPFFTWKRLLLAVLIVMAFLCLVGIVALIYGQVSRPGVINRLMPLTQIWPEDEPVVNPLSNQPKITEVEARDSVTPGYTNDDIAAWDETGILATTISTTPMIDLSNNASLSNASSSLLPTGLRALTEMLTVFEHPMDLTRQ